jgi:2-keto-4-pentenoate hydratase/2-oxohepta-3-ene-1,7-dioic acid hydratase in catechol pathway
VTERLRRKEEVMQIVRFRWQDRVNWGILEADTIFALDGDLYGDFEKGKEMCQLSDVRLLAPVEPTITVACGRNYMDHIKEMGWAVPEEPSLFFKPANTVIGPEEDIVYPAVSRDLRYEAELCLVIRRLAKNVAEEEALDYVLGYTCFNDVTARDLQHQDREEDAAPPSLRSTQRSLPHQRRNARAFRQIAPARVIRVGSANGARLGAE